MFVRIILVVGLAVLVWSAVARSSQAHGAKQVVTVRPYETLWSIAQRHYGGDVRDAIWQIERANHLQGADVRVGQKSSCPNALVPPARSLRDNRRRMDLDLTFLGTSASAPTANRAPMALLVRRGGDRLLFDCAEGTQRQLMRSTHGLPDIEEIFITHFHADHYLGLPGMLKTFQLRQRELGLTIYGPPGLRQIFDDLRRIFGKVGYPLELVEVRAGEALERDGYRILAFPVHHGVSSVGYALDEDDRPGRFDLAAADALGVPAGPERGALQRGESITLPDGRVLTPDSVLGPARPGRRIVIPGDTAPVETVKVLSEGADVLVHEATFSDEERDRAADTLHSTAGQAAEIARDAGVRLLALTHVSPRYFGAELVREAREIFPATVVPRDFDVIEVPYAERGEPTLVKRGARPERRQASATS